MEQWVPLNREQALAARDFSKAGETFVDYNGQVNEILYSILTPLGYHVHTSVQKFEHIKKHPLAVKHQNDIPHILNNPDLVTPNPENAAIHIFYKSRSGKFLLALTVQMKDGMRYMTTMYETTYIKGLKQNRLLQNQFLYLRGGFKWRRWK